MSSDLELEELWEFLTSPSTGKQCSTIGLNTAIMAIRSVRTTGNL
jgi:hypothetical protein